jgi:hypothetical protein
MKELVRPLERAKAHIDFGFSKVGRHLDPNDPVERALARLAGRSLAISNAIAQLSLHNAANEALPLVRALYEVAGAMTWITEKDGKARAEKFLKECECTGWDGLFKDAPLQERLGADFSELLEASKDFRSGNATSVPWSHVFEQSRGAGSSPEKTLALAARAMGHVLKALDLKWGQFPGADELLGASPENKEERKESL